MTIETSDAAADADLPESIVVENGGRPMDDDELSKYLHTIAHLDMPLECKIELLRVLRNIMQSFVDRAFGDDAVQLARKDGDEIEIGREGDSSLVLASDDHNDTGDSILTRAFAKRSRAGE